jgi:predicted MFS family arabinose efflux permease
MVLGYGETLKCGAHWRKLPARRGEVPRDDQVRQSVARVLFQHHRARAMLGLSLMVAQAFFYNAIFFTYALTLTRFYDVPPERVGTYLLPFAAGNFVGPLVLGRLFDSLGRRAMIVTTYGMSGLVLLMTGFLFRADVLEAWTHTLLWSVAFFFASAAARSAYLTVSEVSSSGRWRSRCSMRSGPARAASSAPPCSAP